MSEEQEASPVNNAGAPEAPLADPVAEKRKALEAKYAQACMKLGNLEYQNDILSQQQDNNYAKIKDLKNQMKQMSQAFTKLKTDSGIIPNVGQPVPEVQETTPVEAPEVSA